jgi:hypothetical protein
MTPMVTLGFVLCTERLSGSGVCVLDEDLMLGLTMEGWSLGDGEREKERFLELGCF